MLEPQIFEVVAQTALYTIYWQDEARTICVIQSLSSQWTWDEALKAIQHFDQVVRSVQHPVYGVYLFEYGRNMLPRGGNMIVNLRRLMSIYVPNTAMVIFVRADPALRVFADFITRTFQLFGHNYVYTINLERAQQLIEEHRSRVTRQAPPEV